MLNVIIPAAGAGTRLRPHTHTTPKSMLHVAGKPMLGHILDSIAKVPDLGEVVIVIGFGGDLIQEYVKRDYALPIRFVEQENLQGLGYAVHLALQSLSDDPVLVVLGDTILDVDYRELINAGPNALGVKEVDDPRRFGVVEIKDNRITRLVEKPQSPPSNLAVIGLYYLSDTQVLKQSLSQVIESEITTKGEYQMTDALQGMVDSGVDMRAVPVDGWFDCGKLETLLETNRHLLIKLRPESVAENSVIVPPVYIAPDARVSYSVLGPHVSVDSKAIVERSIIANSIICQEAEVRNTVLADAMIGANAQVLGSPQFYSLGDHSVMS